jgi:hypothetical protein
MGPDGKGTSSVPHGDVINAVSGLPPEPSYGRSAGDYRFRTQVPGGQPKAILWLVSAGAAARPFRSEATN